jgi:hypothetical protein
MKEKLEVATNIVLICLACVIGYQSWQTRRTPENPPSISIHVGDRLPSPAGYNWNAHPSTLVLALKDGCRFCEESFPFYQRLAALEQAKQTDAHLVAVFPDDPAAVRRIVEMQKLAVETLPSIEFGQLKVLGTPTLILADRQGQVSKVWIGELTAREEVDVVTAISKRGTNGARNESALLPHL